MKAIKLILVLCLLVPTLSYADWQRNHDRRIRQERRDLDYRERRAYDASHEFEELKVEYNTKVVLYDTCSEIGNCYELHEDIEDLQDDLDDTYEEWERYKD